MRKRRGRGLGANPRLTQGRRALSPVQTKKYTEEITGGVAVEGNRGLHEGDGYNHKYYEKYVIATATQQAAFAEVYIYIYICIF